MVAGSLWMPAIGPARSENSGHPFPGHRFCDGVKACGQSRLAPVSDDGRNHWVLAFAGVAFGHSYLSRISVGMFERLLLLRAPLHRLGLKDIPIIGRYRNPHPEVFADLSKIEEGAICQLFLA